MNVTVLLFGPLKELCKHASLSVRAEEGATAFDLLQHVDCLARMSVDVRKTLAVAVNQEYAGWSAVLRDGDEVALLPPVSGGYDAR